jgi:hypothetical protein
MALLKGVKVLFSNVVNVDDFNGKYSIVVGLTEEQAADAEAAGINVKIKEHDGKTQYQVQFKSKFRPRIVAPDGKSEYNLEGAELGRDSQVNVQYKFREYTTPTKQTGTAQDLVAVQVKKIEAANSLEFGDEEDEI